MKYNHFSRFYDLLMTDAQYQKRADYFLQLFERYGGKRPSLLLDAACGTGTFTLLMAAAGIDVIGVDASAEMLCQASGKAFKEGKQILFLNQMLEELDLYGTVDGVTCTLDSLNHITDPGKLQQAFNRIAMFLEPSCLFIFDVNTPYKHTHILANQTFIIEKDKVFCVWQNETDGNTTTSIKLDFFLQQDNGLYTRSIQKIKERAYTVDELESMLNAAGMNILKVFGDLSFNTPAETEERMVVVAQKNL